MFPLVSEHGFSTSFWGLCDGFEETVEYVVNNHDSAMRARLHTLALRMIII